MDKKELRNLLKPMIKDLIKEVLAEIGAGAVLAEVKAPQRVEPKPSFERTYREKVIAPAVQQKNNDTKKRMDEELKKSGLLTNNFNPFAGTEPLTENQAAGAAGGRDPNDPGIDISGLVGNSAAIFKALSGGKK